jgi:hypothetical protein
MLFVEAVMASIPINMVFNIILQNTEHFISVSNTLRLLKITNTFISYLAASVHNTINGQVIENET